MNSRRPKIWHTEDQIIGEILAAFRTGTFKEVLGEYKAVSVK